MAKFKKVVPFDRTVIPGTWSDLADDVSVAITVDGNTAAHHAMVLPYPPLNVPNRSVPFVKRLSVNGDGATTNLTVNGSVTPVDAFIPAPVTGDLYITLASILIADTGSPKLNLFGGIARLTTGCRFFVEMNSLRTEQEIDLQSNVDFIRIGTKTVGIGGRVDAYLLNDADAAGNAGYNPILDAKEVSAMGIRLLKGTSDKFGITINDDLTTVATFDIIVKGFIRI